MEHLLVSGWALPENGPGILDIDLGNRSPAIMAEKMAVLVSGLRTMGRVQLLAVCDRDIDMGDAVGKLTTFLGDVAQDGETFETEVKPTVGGITIVNVRRAKAKDERAAGTEPGDAREPEGVIAGAGVSGPDATLGGD